MKFYYRDITTKIKREAGSVGWVSLHKQKGPGWILSQGACRGWGSKSPAGGVQEAMD